MVCKNCGQELRPKDKKCSKCGLKVEDTEQIQITYEDEEVDYVEPPVIVEAHTFIDEESFLKKVNEMDEETKINDDNKRNPLIWLFALLVIIGIGFVFYFVVYPNIVTNHEEEEKVLTFTSEDWKSGEFMIDGAFYQLDKSFTKFYNHNWNLIDPDFLEERLNPLEETDSLLLNHSLNESYKLSVRLRNPLKKELVVKECDVWSVSLDNSILEEDIEFVLPGNIKNGSSEEEIYSLYGKLDDSDIEKDNINGITIYHYKEKDILLDLMIFDEGGLMAFEYQSN